MMGWLARLLGRSSPPGRAGRPVDEAADLGRLSEQTARAFLERAGFRILQANYRCPLGELDLVAEGEGRLVFVEVKARRLTAPLRPARDADARPGASLPAPQESDATAGPPLPLAEGSGVKALPFRASFSSPTPQPSNLPSQ